MRSRDAKGVPTHAGCVTLSPAQIVKKCLLSDCGLLILRNLRSKLIMSKYVAGAEPPVFGGWAGDPGSHRGSWGVLGGSADAHGAYLSTAGEYGSPGSFVPQARPLPGRVPCIPEGSDPVLGLGQGLPWLSAGSRGVVGGSVDGNGCYQTRKRETGAQGCSPPPITPVTRANARAVCMGTLLGRRAYWGSRAAWGVKLPGSG